MDTEFKSLQIPFVLFIVTLIFAPLAFGTVELWSMTVVEILICVTLSILFVLKLQKKHTFLEVPGLVPLFCLLIWMALQLVPIPPELLTIISPGSLAAYGPVIEAGDLDRWLPISVNRKATLYELIRFGSYVLFYILAIQVLSDGRKVKKAVRIILYLAAFIAALAIAQKYTADNLMYWFRTVPERANIMGPWVYKNQYAGFMAMLLPLVFGLFFYYRIKVEDDVSLRVRIASLFSSPSTNIRVYLGLGMMLIFLSVFLSLSRSGVIYTLVSLIIFYLFSTPKGAKKNWSLMLLLVLFVVVYGVFFDVSDVTSRFNKTLTEEGEFNFNRFETWRDTMGMVKTFWLTGAGFGTFVDVFPLFKTMQNPYIYDHAHNDYIEIVTDGGVIAFALIVWFLYSFLSKGVQIWRRRRDQYALVMGGAALAGIVSMLLFSVTDFNMHNGADGLYFFFLCGLFISCGNTRFAYAANKSLLSAMSVFVQRAVVVLLFLMVVLVIVFPIRAYVARGLYREVEQVYISKHLSVKKLYEITEKLKKCHRYDSLEGTYLTALGEVEKIRGEDRFAFDNYLLAGLRNPLQGAFLQKIALMLPEEKDELANTLMEQSYQRSFQKNELALVFVEWLLWKEDKDRAITVLRESLQRSYSLISKVLSIFGSRFSPEDMIQVLPENAEAWGRYGRYLEKRGLVVEAEGFLRKAVDLYEKSGARHAGWHNTLYWYYKRQNREEDAVLVLLRGIKAVPEYADFHIRLGDYYKKQGLTIKAKAEYEQALIFSPGNDKVKEKIEQLGLQ